MDTNSPCDEVLVDRYGDPLFSAPLPPRCGWLSPDGRFVACIPWEHTQMAWDIVKALDLEGRDSSEMATEVLFRMGWIKIARKHRGDLRRLGGRFCFEHPNTAFVPRAEALGTLTPAQAELEASWMVLDAIDLTPETS